MTFGLHFVSIISVVLPVLYQMSQTPGTSQGGGKAPRERRRLSSDQPYKRQKSSTAMPVATRHSPARDTPAAPAAAVPLNEIMHELSLLRQSMESKFGEASKRSDALRAEVVGKLEANDQAVSELQLAVTDVTLSVDQNQRAIHEVRAEVERREIELPDKVRSIVNEALDRRSGSPARSPPGSGVRPRRLGATTASSAEAPATGAAADSKDEAYLIARRSLRLWPVSREGNLLERTREFLVNELCLDQQYAAGLSLAVRRTGGPARADPRPAGGAVRDEVLVKFDSARERDDVRSYAKNLERKGRGLRLEVPDHLWSNFRVLQQVAYELKLKNPTLRRNILFDDANHDLKMDFTTDGSTWKTVVPRDARKSLEKCRPSRTRRLSVTDDELNSLLGDAPEQDTSMGESEEF